MDKLQEILSEKDRTSYIMAYEEDVYWTNGVMLVKNDPNINNYFGDYTLDKILEKNKTYHLKNNGNFINIANEYLYGPLNDAAKNILNKKFEDLKLLKYPEKDLRNKLHANGLKQGISFPFIELITSDRGYGLCLNEKYFDYIMSLTKPSENIYFDRAMRCTYFAQDDKLFAALMAAKPDVDIERELLVKSEKINNGR
jgi:hypothetical protein